MQPTIHSLTSVLFPKPAGAEISVSLDLKPWFGRRFLFSRSSRRARWTTLRRGGGRKSLVARIGMDIDLTREGNSCYATPMRQSRYEILFAVKSAYTCPKNCVGCLIIATRSQPGNARGHRSSICLSESLPVEQNQNRPNRGENWWDWQGKSPPENRARRKQHQ